MGTHSMTADNIGPMVDRLYGDTSANQSDRESWVNGSQASATEVLYTVEWRAVESLGVYRRAILDDGDGMTRKDMPRFLNKLGGSGKAVGALADNFGIGLKVSTLPWNHYGLVVISRSAETSETTMMWIHRDGDTYGARMFDVSPSDDDVDFQDTVPLDRFEEYVVDGVDWTKVFPSNRADHGTLVVLCGMTGKEDTIFGDPNRSAEKSKFARQYYFDTRFWDLPIDTGEHYFGNLNDRNSWPKSEAEWKKELKEGTAQYRSFYGLEKQLAAAGTATAKYPGRGIQAQGTVVVPATQDTLGAEIAWTLFKEPYKMTNGVHTPLRGVRFESHPGVEEVYDFSNDGRDAILNKFMAVGEIRDRMAIIITPKPGSKDVIVYPNPGRTVLRWQNRVSASQPLPWWDWIAYWNANRPAEIDKAVADYYASLSSGSAVSDVDYERLGKRYLGALRREVTKLVPSKSTKAVPGTPTDDSETRKKRKKPKPPIPPKPPVTPRTPPPPSVPGVVARRVPTAMVRVECDALTEPEHIAVVYDEADKSAIINTNSTAYKRCRDFIAEKYEAQMTGSESQIEKKREAVDDEIQVAMKTHVALALTEIVSDARTVDDGDDKEAMQHNAALSNTLRGIRAIEEIASGPIGTRLKQLSKGAPKAA